MNRARQTGVVDDFGDDRAYDHWRAALRSLTSDSVQLERWQERRLRFAHRVGALLTEGQGAQAAVRGPVLYGVFTAGMGLCYVGQTQQAQRRLRDLPIGESHHLANTLPPELWDRVVVVSWPALVARVGAAEQRLVEDLGERLCSLALEHRLQLETAPPLNSRRRGSDGQWKERRLAASRSAGAAQARNLPELWRLVSESWDELAAAPTPESGSVLVRDAGRVVFPAGVERLASPPVQPLSGGNGAFG